PIVHCGFLQFVVPPCIFKPMRAGRRSGRRLYGQALPAEQFRPVGTGTVKVVMESKENAVEIRAVAAIRLMMNLGTMESIDDG
ncbi:hypothetical protein ABTO83_19930, partial [Acinetobacter baumannii]